MTNYKLSDETKTKLLNNPLSRLVFGNLLYREVATTIPTLSSVGIDDEKESNLSDNERIYDEINDKAHFLRHLSDGEWLFEKSKVFGNAKVYRDDLVDGSDNVLSDGLNDLSSQDNIQM